MLSSQGEDLRGLQNDDSVASLASSFSRREWASCDEGRDDGEVLILISSEERHLNHCVLDAIHHRKPSGERGQHRQHHSGHLAPDVLWRCS